MPKPNINLRSVEDHAEAIVHEQDHSYQHDDDQRRDPAFFRSP